MEFSRLTALFLSLSSIAFAAPQSLPRRIAAATDPLHMMNLMERATAAGVCDVKSAKLPQAPTPLAAPSAGLTLQYVVIGRGTQNYTCASSTKDTIPVASGALATLFNASCIAAPFPALLAMMPAIAAKLPVPAYTDQNAPGLSTLAGHHYFADLTTPVFDLNTVIDSAGKVFMKKLAATPAPNPSADVPWLKLGFKSSEGGCAVQEVYRVNTVGGVAPATCDGQAAAFTVQYAAEYWFYSKLS